MKISPLKKWIQGIFKRKTEMKIDPLKEWVARQEEDFTIQDAAIKGMGLDSRELTRDSQTRIGIALRQLGCTRIEKKTHVIRYWYRPPVR